MDDLRLGRIRDIANRLYRGVRHTDHCIVSENSAEKESGHEILERLADARGDVTMKGFHIATDEVLYRNRVGYTCSTTAH